MNGAEDGHPKTVSVVSETVVFETDRVGAERGHQIVGDPAGTWRADVEKAHRQRMVCGATLRRAQNYRRVAIASIQKSPPRSSRGRRDGPAITGR